MSGFIAFVKHEAREAVFPTVFFLFAFHFAIATKILLLDSYDVEVYTVASATVLALVAAKAILIIDATSLVRLFSNSRLIYQVLWKACIYMVLITAFRYLEEVIHFWRLDGSLSVANAKMLEEFSWPHFWVVQLWMVVSVVAYSTIAGLNLHFGRGSIRKALLHKHQI